MHASVFLAAWAAVSVLAAPSYRELTRTADSAALDIASEYFNLLATTVKSSLSSTPVCDLSAATLPTDSVSPALPPPSSGLVLKHVAIGRGTQNYTCDTTNATAAPVAVGAVATLFNASCIAATSASLLDMLPALSLAFNLSDSSLDSYSDRLYPSNLLVSGHHYFTNTTTPYFNLDSPSLALGHAPCAKNNTEKAPAAESATATTATTATTTVSNVGQDGEAAVPWLKLLAYDTAATTGNLREVYRMQTAGGSAPATCDGQAAVFEVQYAAQYWFYESESESA